MTRHANIDPVLLMKFHTDRNARHTVIADFSAAAADATSRSYLMDDAEDMIVAANPNSRINREGVEMTFTASAWSILQLAETMGAVKIRPARPGDLGDRGDDACGPDGGRGAAVNPKLIAA